MVGISGLLLRFAYRVNCPSDDSDSCKWHWEFVLIVTDDDNDVTDDRQNLKHRLLRCSQSMHSLYTVNSQVALLQFYFNIINYFLNRPQLTVRRVFAGQVIFSLVLTSRNLSNTDADITTTIYSTLHIIGIEISAYYNLSARMTKRKHTATANKRWVHSELINKLKTFIFTFRLEV